MQKMKQEVFQGKKTMRVVYFIRAALLALLASSTLVFAQERGTPEEAKALVDMGLARIKEVGNEKAFAEFRLKDGKWRTKDLYIFVVKFDGTVVTHDNKGMIGRSLIEVKDQDGKYFAQEMAEIAKSKGAGWIEYKFTEPNTQRIVPKVSYVARIPGQELIIGAGAYKHKQ